MRTLIDLPETHVRALDAYRKPLGISRAEAVRRAIAAHVPMEPKRPRDFSQVFGAWKHRKLDGLSFERKLRTEWDHREVAIKTNTPPR